MEEVENDKVNSFCLDDFILESKIGSGSYGKVYKTKEKLTDKIYAAKILIKPLDENDDNARMDLVREINIMSKLNHPSVLKLIYYSPVNFKKAPKPVIITEYASNGSLADIISISKEKISNQILDDTSKLIIIYGIVAGMSYLHSHDIMHRDLKPANILLDNFLFPKIADFGLSKISQIDNDRSNMKSAQGQIKGTPIYMSPEIWENAEYSKAGDVYAFSIILYEIITNERPFKNFNFFEIPLKLMKGYRPSFNDDVPNSYRNLIERCWQQEPNDRPTFDEILNELKNDRCYITEKVDEEKYLNYIEYIDNYRISFDFSKNLISLSNLKKIDEQESFSLSLKYKDFKSKFYTNHQLWIELNDDCKKLVIDAEDDPEKQFQMARNLIECRNFFNQNTEIGMMYLKNSYNEGCEEALIYYIKMLIKGKTIYRNIEKVTKLLENRLKHNVPIYSLLYGKLFIKEKKYSKAKEYLISSIDLGNDEAMYQYGKIESDETNSIKYYQKAIENGNIKAMFKLGLIYLNKENKDEGIKLIKASADKGFSKAQYYYSQLLEKGELISKDNEQSIKYLERAANQGLNSAMRHYFEIDLNKENNQIKDESKYYLKSACDKGDIDSIFLYSNLGKNEKEIMKYIKIAADNNHTRAIEIIGPAFVFGVGVERDIKKAIFYFKKGIEKGSVKSMLHYGYIYFKGDGVPINKEKAAKYYKMAADKGDSNGLNSYGLYLANGNESNIEEAVKYYKMAIEKGNTTAMINYGMMLAEGDRIQADYEEAAKYFKLAIEKGSAKAMFHYAHFLLTIIKDKDRIDEALDYLKKAVDNKILESFSYYGEILLLGNYVPPNKDEAIKYFKIGIKNRDPRSMFYYAYMLDKGVQIPINKEEAIKYYKMAIDRGDGDAMFYYSLMLLNGDGIPMDKDEGMKYLKMAVDARNPSAMYKYALMLLNNSEDDSVVQEGVKYLKMAADEKNEYALNLYGLMLLNGDKVQMDKNAALECFKLAMEEKNCDAIYNYACMLEKGDGTDKNIGLALQYFQLAAAYGSQEAKQKCKSILFGNNINNKNDSNSEKKIIKRRRSLFTFKIINFSEFKDLNNIDKYYVIEAENGDAESMLNIAHSFIDNEDKIDKGFKYLDQACKKKNFEAMSYYMKLNKKKEKASLLSEEIVSRMSSSNSILNLAKILLSKESFDATDENRNMKINYILAKKYCKEAANLGNTKAMILYSTLCNKAKNNKYGSIKTDKLESFKYIEMATKCGNSEAMAYYGNFYEFGHGIIKTDEKKAVKYYKMSYEKGDLNGYAFYGYSLIEGIGGIDKNISEGIRLIKYSADKQNIQGLNIYGYYLSVGIEGLERDDYLSFINFKKAADLGQAASMRNVSSFYRDGFDNLEKDIFKAIQYLNMGIEEGNLASAYDLGNLYININNKIDIIPDLAKGYQLIKYAADLGHKNAIYDYVSDVLLSFDDIDQNLLIKYLEKGVELGATSVIQLYAALLLDGDIPKNNIKAVKLMKMAADLGNKDAMANYASILNAGDLVPANHEEAMKYWEMSKQQGS